MRINLFNVKFQNVVLWKSAVCTSLYACIDMFQQQVLLHRTLHIYNTEMSSSLKRKNTDTLYPQRRAMLVRTERRPELLLFIINNDSCLFALLTSKRTVKATKYLPIPDRAQTVVSHKPVPSSDHYSDHARFLPRNAEHSVDHFISQLSPIQSRNLESFHVN